MRLNFLSVGAVSEWNLELPATGPNDPRSFDYSTISDVVLHMRYTARQAGQPMKGAALKDIKEQMVNAGAYGTARLFSVRHEFPMEWALFKRTPGGGAGQLTLELNEEHFPFWTADIVKAGKRKHVRTWQQVDKDVVGDGPAVASNNEDILGPLVINGLSTAITDLWMVVEWGSE